ncbi:GNAT family N-acetyltransferase [Loktanella sp. S4079]|uniref:GNAT family N-acetyltransferase n=1 Tax=Loktanella sp. S4079 TaxID=579483 RepID=UPI0005FA47C1|nr:GNAT family N-acetyltransferase [Loktanella sp. S4079]KJZ20630.1 drug:proton antiporter [Loktanella sp. S4079]
MIKVVTDYTPCIDLRRAVFMGEQGISEEEELDNLDEGAVHFLATVDDVPVGTARVLMDGDIGKIGRICVIKEQRGTGLGARLVLAAMAYLREQPMITRAKLSAQDHAIGFYEKLGFVPNGPFYDDAGIPHKDMYAAL